MRMYPSPAYRMGREDASAACPPAAIYRATVSAAFLRLREAAEFAAPRFRLLLYAPANLQQ